MIIGGFGEFGEFGSVNSGIWMCHLTTVRIYCLLNVLCAEIETFSLIIIIIY